MTGRVFIVTGANSGIGYEVARHLCEGGNDVILACRNEEKGKAAVEKILAGNPNALATFMELDLADLSSVRKFVEDFHSTGKKLHVLINNAGLSFSFKDRRRQFTKDNFEMTMGTNHLGPFLLTHLLLEDLKKTALESEDARIVMVTSTMHDTALSMNRKRGVVTMDKENFFFEKPGTYNGLQAYKDSKLAQVLTMYEIARQLQDTNVSINCVCPGFIPKTGLVRHNSAAERFMIRHLLSGIFKVMKVTRTLDHGMKCVVDAATNENLKGVSGKFFSDMAEKASSEESQNEDLQKNIYELSARYCHLEGYEPLDAPVPPPPEEPVKTKSKKSKDSKDEKQDEPGTSGEGQEVKDKVPKNEDEDNKEIKFIDEDDRQGEQVKTESAKTDETKDKETEQKVEEKTEDSKTEQEEKTEEIKKVEDVTPTEQMPEITAQ